MIASRKFVLTAAAVGPVAIAGGGGSTGAATTATGTSLTTTPAPSNATNGPTGPGDVQAAPNGLVVGVAYPFDLLTHCGICETLVGGTYFEADTPLVGPGNPPKGWVNPYQRGTMTLLTTSTAEFHDSAGHTVRFHARPGATGFKNLCD